MSNKPGKGWLRRYRRKLLRQARTRRPSEALAIARRASRQRERIGSILEGL